MRLLVILLAAWLILMPIMVNAQTTTSSPSPVTIRPQSHVSVQKLDDPDPNSAGLLNDSNGGLGSDMWSGTSIRTIEKLIPMLPSPVNYHSLSELQRRLLLTSAMIPKAPPGFPSLITLRTEKLLAMGDVEGARRLIETIPNTVISSRTRRSYAEIALTRGDIDTACNNIPTSDNSTDDDGFKQKLQILCQILGGNAMEAGLGIDMLREQNIQDPLFFAAINQLRGLGGSSKEIIWKNLSPLSLAAIGKSAIPIPDNIGTDISPALWPVLAGTSETRLQLAEKGEAAGLIGIEELRNLYVKMPAATQEIALVSSNNDLPKTAKGRAIFYKAVLSQTINPVAQANLINRVLAGSTGQPSYFTMARLYAPILLNLTPNFEMSNFAIPFTRALLAAQQNERAQFWLMLARTPTGDNSNPDIALLPLIWAAGIHTAIPTSVISEWQNSQSHDPVGRRRLALLTAILSGMGEKMNVDDLLPLYEGTSTITTKISNPGLRLGLLRTMSGGGKGIAALMAICATVDLAQVDPVDLGLALSSLRNAGLHEEAQKIALEAILVNGI